MILNSKKLQRVFKSRILQHAAFWIASLVAITFALRVSAEVEWIDLVYALLFHVPLAILVYINLLLIIPAVLSREWYLMFIVLELMLILAFSWFYQLLFDSLVDKVLPGYFFVSTYNIADYSIFAGGYLVITTLLKLAKGWFKVAEIEKEKTSMELQSLRSQLNPHFLFNSLNTIYGMSLQNSKQVPDSLLNLSDMLRYSLYDASRNKVLVKDEIKFISDFIELMKKRVSPDKIKVEFNAVGMFDDKTILPMLFLPLVENCFKHVEKGDKGAFIRIDVNRENDTVVLNAQNSFNNTLLNKEGIGMANVRKRLEMIYGKNYTFTSGRQDNVFWVCLKVQLWD